MRFSLRCPLRQFLFQLLGCLALLCLLRQCFLLCGRLGCGFRHLLQCLRLRCSCLLGFRLECSCCFHPSFFFCFSLRCLFRCLLRLLLQVLYHLRLFLRSCRI